jgi:hypothetical protein
MYTRAKSPKRSRSASPKATGRGKGQNPVRMTSPKRVSASKPSSPKTSPPVRKTLLDKTFEGKKYEKYMQYILMVVVFAVYITCLVLYLVNYTEVRDALETHFNFTSSFLYKPWFVIILLTFSMLGLLYVVRHLTTYILPIVFLFTVFFTFFILTCVFVYFKVPTQQSTTPQIMSVIAFIALVLLTIFIIPYMKNSFFSLVCLLPTYFLVISGIYLGGVMNQVYIA